MQVELKPNGVSVDNGMGGKKIIAYQDFINEISKLVTESNISVSRNLALPEGCYVINQSGRDATIGMYFPERRADLVYQERKYSGVQLPNIVIMVGVRDFAIDGEPAILDGIHWFCTDLPLSIMPRVTFRTLDNLPSELQGHVWCLPFPNMYSGNSCSMCTGSNSFVSRFTNNQYSVMSSYYYDLFMGSRFNNDLSAWMLREHRNWDAWLNVLKQDEPFPYTNLSRG